MLELVLYHPDTGKTAVWSGNITWQWIEVIARYLACTRPDSVFQFKMSDVGDQYQEPGFGG